MVFYTGKVCPTAGHRPCRCLPAVRDMQKPFFMKNGEKPWSFMPIFFEKRNGSILTIQKNYGIIVK